MKIILFTIIFYLPILTCGQPLKKKNLNYNNGPIAYLVNRTDKDSVSATVLRNIMEMKTIDSSFRVSSFTAYIWRPEKSVSDSIHNIGPKFTKELLNATRTLVEGDIVSFEEIIILRNVSDRIRGANLAIKVK